MVFCFKPAQVTQLKLFKAEEKNLEMSREIFLNIFAKEEQLLSARELYEDLFCTGSRLSYGSQNINM